MTGRLDLWIRRLDRTAEAVGWFVRRVLLVVLLVLFGGGLVWYAVLEYLTADPWSGPDATADAFGWQVWAAGAAAVTGLVGLLLIEHVRYALTVPFAALSWILARFRTGGRAAWLPAAGGIVLAVVLVVGLLTVPGSAGRRGTEAPPPTTAEVAATTERVRAKAMEVHAIVGAPPIREDLRLIATTCYQRDRRPGDPSRAGYGYLATRPGVDPVGRMERWAAGLRGRGWTVTYPYPVARRTGNVPDERILVAVHDGFEIKIDAQDPPDLWIEVRGVC